MPEFIRKITGQITDFWNSLKVKSKIQIIVALVVTVVALGILVYVLSQPTMTKYASGLEPDKMNQIVTVLDEAKIRYEISEDATTIYVDSKRKKDVTLLTEEIGILSDAEMTWDQALSNSLTTTSSEKQIKFQLAFEEELNNKIETLDSIKNAYVKLDVAKEDTTIFDENKKSSATVILETKQDLNENQVAGIVNFLKNAVSNLEEGNISMMSTNGKLLFDGSSKTSTSGNIGSKLDYEFARELNVEAKLRSVLLAGGEFDDATVSVDLAINFDELSSVSEQVTGVNGTNKGVITHEYKSESEGTNSDAGGAPGTDANGDEITDTMIDTGSNSFNTSTVSEIDYEPSKTVTSETKNIGNIIHADSTVSVILNKFVKYDQAILESQDALGDLTWEEYKAQMDVRTKIEDLDPDLIRLVQTTAKVDNVAVMAYSNPIFIEKEVKEIPFLNYISVLIIVILIGLLGYAVYKGTTPVEITEVEPELSVEDLLVSTKSKQELESIEFDGKSETRIQIEKFVQENPDAVALLLRNWLNEDWE
ncbi:MAG: flagellar M-ring protein FliF [Firmicutes bacterium HGW-Firmicutes-7]|nr:MAG: flagellar M-ring protein FliF [Firmicutes bacterium HGW-Firmicutes-7]